MNEHRYVATDRNGVEHGPASDLTWPLPTRTDHISASDALVSVNPPLVLRNARALLEVLDERIFHAASTEATALDSGDEVPVHNARLTAEAHWDVETAATFALDCVEHVLGDSASATLPDGATLESTVRDARDVLTSTSGGPGEKRLGLLARLAAARRLRRRGESVGDLAFEQLVGDTAEDIAGLEDPIWATLAALGEALLASLEAVRHHALPRYVAAREEPSEEHHQDEPLADPPIIVTPWGPIVLGAEHRSAFEPAWLAARDAAGRARDAARDRSGAVGETAERDWQAARLEQLLNQA